MFSFLKNFTLLLVFLFPFSVIFSAESLNKILATIKNTSITQIDYEYGEDKYKKLSKFLPKINHKASMKTQVLDFLIARAIVDITAEEESIQVTEKRIDTEIEKRMEVMGIKDRAVFEKNIQAQTGMSFDMWVSELPYQIKKGQLLQVRVNTKLPSDKEILSWYNANKNKVGFEIRLREIALIPSKHSLEEETRISKEITAIRNEALKDPESFKLIASGPRNQSNYKNGGLIDWIPAFELYKQNKIAATVAMGLPEGKISDVFRDERKRYCIIKMEGKRPTPLELVKKGIQNMLYRDKEEDSFDNWVLSRRREISITIYDKEYIKENKLDTPEESFQRPEDLPTDKNNEKRQ
ncbi:MAG: putative peptidyl-prolyl cis-trans isomerase [Leptospiraceae bacterium]|nr:putative peptidyl-prolyl cis-trans isomerase [Leptospiraceae bacterium]MCK6382404.1 putative peptidyl-prolyl cis-trans isomerase [Leptospiraceae bacterium]NUM42009.1 putative peptidyl-prolyl cis-trans isomerase [Leptospiraceae bacterium]